jgi:hypothetical protein
MAVPLIGGGELCEGECTHDTPPAHPRPGLSDSTRQRARPAYAG